MLSRQKKILPIKMDKNLVKIGQNSIKSIFYQKLVNFYRTVSFKSLSNSLQSLINHRKQPMETNYFWPSNWQKTCQKLAQNLQNLNSMITWSISIVQYTLKANN
jgi:hypothetical protein